MKLQKKHLPEVYSLGTLTAGDFIYIAADNAGDGADDDDTRIRFRIKAVVQADHWVRELQLRASDFFIKFRRLSKL